MSRRGHPVQLAGFLVALRAKGETVEEVHGLVDSMLAHAVPIEVPGPSVDVVGTGGDRAHTVNISTMAALVVAGRAPRVVKHGNRAASSSPGAPTCSRRSASGSTCPRSGWPQIAERGRVSPSASPPRSTRRCGTPGAARSELGVPTAFNFLGPLTNPAQPRAGADRRGRRADGADDGRRARRAWHVARWCSAATTASTSSPPPRAATVWEVRDGAVTEHRLDPAATSASRASSVDDLRGGDAAYNAGWPARSARREDGPGPRRRPAQRGGGPGGRRHAARDGLGHARGAPHRRDRSRGAGRGLGSGAGHPGPLGRRQPLRSAHGTKRRPVASTGRRSVRCAFTGLPSAE